MTRYERIFQLPEAIQDLIFESYYDDLRERLSERRKRLIREYWFVGNYCSGYIQKDDLVERQWFATYGTRYPFLPLPRYRLRSRRPLDNRTAFHRAYLPILKKVEDKMRRDGLPLY